MKLDKIKETMGEDMYERLGRIKLKGGVEKWFNTSNEYFDYMSPSLVYFFCQGKRIERMIYRVEGGVPLE